MSWFVCCAVAGCPASGLCGCASRSLRADLGHRCPARGRARRNPAVSLRRHGMVAGEQPCVGRAGERLQLDPVQHLPGPVDRRRADVDSARGVNDDFASGKVADHFQPTVAAGPGGAVAVAFYDRQANFCIHVSVQPFTGTAAGAVPVGAKRPSIQLPMGSVATAASDQRRRQHGRPAAPGRARADGLRLAQ